MIFLGCLTIVFSFKYNIFPFVNLIPDLSIFIYFFLEINIQYDFFRYFFILNLLCLFIFMGNNICMIACFLLLLLFRDNFIFLFGLFLLLIILRFNMLRLNIFILFNYSLNHILKIIINYLIILFNLILLIITRLALLYTNLILNF